MRSARTSAFASLWTGLVSVAVLALALVPEGQADGRKRFTLEVTQDGGTASLNFSDLPDGPPRGSTGVINGNLYRGGAILTDGSVDPDAVPIGTWRCAFDVLAPDPDGEDLVAAATYYFSFHPNEQGYARSTLIVQGLNVHFDGSDPIPLTVVGGTGVFRGVTGEVIETVLGENDTGTDLGAALNLRYHFRIEKRSTRKRHRRRY